MQLLEKILKGSQTFQQPVQTQYHRIVLMSSCILLQLHQCQVLLIEASDYVSQTGGPLVI